MYQHPRYLPAGDCALAVEIGDAISPDINRGIRELSIAIETHKIHGVFDLVPTYRSLLVYYDPTIIDFPQLEMELETLRKSSSARVVTEPRIVHIPTYYGGDMGPDLAFVAQHNGLDPNEVVRIHSDTNYLVYMLGFSPGFPYLGGMSERIAAPRLDTPRTIIPAGSVGIADHQTGIYPSETPGGWQLIGRTPLTFFDPVRQRPAMVEPGDYIKFVPIKEDEYEIIKRQVGQGTYHVVTEGAIG